VRGDADGEAREVGAQPADAVEQRDQADRHPEVRGVPRSCGTPSCFRPSILTRTSSRTRPP
jgi:hypothetical protein